MLDKSKIILVTPEEDAAITAAALSDPDAQPLTEEQLAQFRPWRLRLLPPPGSPKVSLTIDYDADLIDVFKSTGEGWEVGMNAVLREWAIRRGYLPFPD
ncbi:BrnA antitoxin family protein [Duganella sp. CT11-25]|uniref:BrnA antitoxin family protein n=1 Tax=unclassified Duganella TaxID=2636909 RepID=UPI0039AF0189